MKQPLVSIIIPAYNYGRYLAEAIDSALAQTYKHTEILVIDDGSTDDTAAVAKRYGKQITYIYKPNGGLSHTRNFGQANSHGDYVVFLDADDKLAPEFIEKAAAVLDANPSVSFVYTQVQTFGRDHTTSQHPDYNLAELKEHNYINAGAMVRSSVFADVHYNDQMKAGWEDWDFYISLAEHGYYGKLLDEPLLLYRKHTDMGSMSDAMANEKLQRRLLLGLAWRHPRFFGKRRIARLAAFNAKRDLRDLAHKLRKRG